MAEVWYLEIDSENLEDKTKLEHTFIECIELLELKPEGWHAEAESMPDLKTGDPFVDQSGLISVCVRVLDDELEPFPDKRWKPGWYKSKVTILGYENKLRLKAK
ncbi:MAG: hypothetical protein AAF462_06690 [Thermodesulfobacteriota bacterium]